jgi:hypothetical protein
MYVYAWEMKGGKFTTPVPIKGFNKNLRPSTGGNDAFALPSHSADRHPALSDIAPPQATSRWYFGSRILNHGRPDQGP